MGATEQERGLTMSIEAARPRSPPSVAGRSLALDRLRWRLRGRRRRRGAARPSASSASPSWRQANKQVIADFKETADGEGVTFESRTAPRATRAAPSRPGQTPTSCTSRSSPTCSASSTQAWSPTTGRTTTTKGIATSVRRGLRGPQGQPRGHRDLGRPGQAGRRDHHAQPRLLRLRASGTSSRRAATSPATAAPRTTRRRT